MCLARFFMSNKCSGQCESVVTDSSIKEFKNTDAFDGRFTTEYTVPKMDCPSEERLIRLALDGIEPPVGLKFDIPNRLVKVFHDAHLDEITTKLQSLNLGATLEITRESSAKENEGKETIILKWLLIINGFMFFCEFIAGWIAQSAGLIADSLDMFADAAVYGLAIYAVGKSIKMKLKAAHISGLLQVILALGALSEVLRRFIYGSEPVSNLMMIFGALALIANVTCLFLISDSKENGAHMKASWIFSANDVIANIGVILAGLLVTLTSSRYPDLVIGLIIALVVLNGARRILQLKA